MFGPALLAALALSPAQTPKPFELKDGDRIVWVGGTLVEREQRYGYWETALHAAFPKIDFTLRNLGWSGDTVWGESRGRFDFANPDKCFRQLVDQTLELKPTVIFVSYGQNESFEGEAGLPRFEQGLNKLLDALKPANARIVLFTPPSLTFKTPQDAALAKYSDVIRTTADRRGPHLADLRGKLIALPLTDNGIHPTEDGYRHLTPSFLGVLGRRQDVLDWAAVEPLRQAIVEKNQLFFHRWRPENETYLFGFRKHEQGKNAKEVAEFDPLVSKAEAEISRLRKALTK